MWYRLGRGEVIAITAPALFGNAQLRNADNLRFAYNVIANHGERPSTSTSTATTII